MLPKKENGQVSSRRPARLPNLRCTFTLYEPIVRAGGLLCARARSASVRSKRCRSRGSVAGHVREQLHFYAAVLLAAFRGIVRRHFLILADADQVEAVSRNVVLGDQVLHHRIGAARRSEERRVGKECRARWSRYN